MNDLITIVVPVYNVEKYLPHTLESICGQTYTNLQILLIDDGSTDDSLAVCHKWARQDNRIQVYEQENQGVARTRNKGIQLATGKYVMFLDADDWWEPGKLKEQLKRLEETGYVLCSTGRELMKADGSSTGRTIPVKEKITYRELLKHNSINCSSVLLRREDALAFPMEHDDSHEDYITWLKVVRKYGHATGINRPYLKYRLSQGGKSRNKAKSAIMTYQVYRYVGYGPLRSACFFLSYALHGIWKYR